MLSFSLFMLIPILSVRQLRAPIHDVDIPRVAEQPVAFLGREFRDDAEPLQMPAGLVDGGRSDAGLASQPL